MAAISRLSAQSHFNSRPSARGDATSGRSPGTADISIHAPPRGATAMDLGVPLLCIFQFTPLREGRRPNCGSKYVEMLFQFTPLREGRQQVETEKKTATLFQFTPLREGRQNDGILFVVVQISIHAPPRGATWGNWVRKIKTIDISIHAPPRGATGNTSKHNGGPLLISIHAPPRGATPRMVRRLHLRRISIHAPPRGATYDKLRVLYHKIFQFTPLREGRHGYGQKRCYDVLFQFTPLREGRRDQRRLAVPEKHFNSRPSARGDTS